MRGRRALAGFFILALVISLVPASRIPVAEGAVGASWLTGWSYRKQFNITGTSAGTLTDYTMRVVVGANNLSALEWGTFIPSGVDMITEADSSRVGVTSVKPVIVLRDPSTMEPVKYNGVYWGAVCVLAGGSDTIEIDIYNSTDLLSWTEYARNIVSEPGGNETQIYQPSDFFYSEDAPEPYVIGYSAKDAGTQYRGFHIYSQNMSTWIKSPNNPQNDYIVAGWAPQGAENWGVARVNESASHGHKWFGVFEGEGSVNRISVGIMYNDDDDPTSGNWTVLGRAHTTGQTGFVREVDPYIFKNGEDYYIFYEIFTQYDNEHPTGIMHTTEAGIFNVSETGWIRSEHNPILDEGDVAGFARAYNVNGTVWLSVKNTPDSIDTWYYIGNHVGLNGYNNADFSDVRFTASDGETLLDHAMIYNESTYAIFEVEIDSIPTGGESCSYLYYGNVGASDASDESAVWSGLFYDFFEGATVDPLKWNETGTATNDVYSQADRGDGTDGKLIMTDGGVVTSTWNTWAGLEINQSGWTLPVNGWKMTLYGTNIDGDNINRQARVGIVGDDTGNTAHPYKVGVWFDDSVTDNDFRWIGFYNDVQNDVVAGTLNLHERHSITIQKDDDNTTDGWLGLFGLGESQPIVNQVTTGDINRVKLTYQGHTNNNMDVIEVGSAFLIEEFIDPEPVFSYWGDQEGAPAGNTAPALGAYTISNWDGDAVYTDESAVNFWLQCSDADGGSDVASHEFAILTGSVWNNFTFTVSTGLWTKDTPGSPIFMGSDGQGSTGTTKNIMGFMWIVEGASETYNVVVYGRVTDASSATSGWGVVPGIGFNILSEPDSGSDSGSSGGYTPPGDEPLVDEPGDPYWWTDPDILDDLSDEDLELLADSLGVDYLEDATRADLIAGILELAEDEGFEPFSGCGLDEEAKLAKLEYLQGLTIQELRLECQSLGISYKLWRDPEPYIILIFTVGYQCSPPDAFYDQGYFDPEDWDEDGVLNWDDPDMFDETRMGLGARVEEMDLSASVPWVQTNGWALIILLLFVGFMYSQVKQRDKPGSRGESLIRPREGTYSPGGRSR